MKVKRITGVPVLLLLVCALSIGQTTAFNFQGRLNDGSSPANGRYDLQFKLFDSITGGSQVGTTVDRPNLLLINGVFSTTLDFGSSAFTAGDRFVEISVRPNGRPNAHVVLGARQQIMSVPFAVRSANATQADNATNAQNAQLASDASSLGGVSASNYARLNFPNTGNLQTSGNAGFGSVAPNTRLTLSGGPLWTSSQWTASLNMQNASALGWEANSSGQRFGIGQATGGLHFFRTISGFGSTLTPPNVDLRITDNGDIAQPLERNGAVKAMVAITAGGVVARCYNGVSGSSSGNCDISVTQNSAGVVYVNFPFQITNRFWLVTTDASGQQAGVLTASVVPHAAVNSRLIVITKHDGSLEYLPFHLFVF